MLVDTLSNNTPVGTARVLDRGQGMPRRRGGEANSGKGSNYSVHATY